MGNIENGHCMVSIPHACPEEDKWIVKNIHQTQTNQQLQWTDIKINPSKINLLWKAVERDKAARPEFIIFLNILFCKCICWIDFDCPITYGCGCLNSCLNRHRYHFQLPFPINHEWKMLYIRYIWSSDEYDINWNRYLLHNRHSQLVTHVTQTECSFVGIA